MKILSTFIFVCLLLTVSCSKKTHHQQTQTETSPTIEVPTPTSIENNHTEGWEEFEGNRILRGELYTSKGAILGIEDVFISEDYKSKHKSKLRRLIGKTLEMKGDVYIYHCGSMEQCLSQGYMKWLRNVEYMKVIEE